MIFVPQIATYYHQSIVEMRARQRRKVPVPDSVPLKIIRYMTVPTPDFPSSFPDFSLLHRSSQDFALFNISPILLTGRGEGLWIQVIYLALCSNHGPNLVKMFFLLRRYSGQMRARPNLAAFERFWPHCYEIIITTYLKMRRVPAPVFANHCLFAMPESIIPRFAMRWKLSAHLRNQRIG